MRAIVMALVLAVCPPALALAEEYPALYRVVDVAPGDVLNIRNAPGTGGAILGGLPPGQAGVEVVALSPDARWGQINHAEGVGWVSMRYLDRQTRGSWVDGDTALRCLGTEPFWRLDVFLPTHRAEFHAVGAGFGDGGAELVTDAGALPSTAFPPTLAIPFSGSRDGFAVVRGAQCHDGMSDRRYGLETQIYWRGDRAGLSGCCMLTN